MRAKCVVLVFLVVMTLQVQAHEGHKNVASANKFQYFFEGLSYDPHYEIDIFLDDGTRELLQVTDFFERLLIGWNYGPLVQYYARIRFLGLTIPEEVSELAVPFLVNRFKMHKDLQALRFLSHHDRACKQVLPEIIDLLESNDQTDILFALIALPSIKEPSLATTAQPFTRSSDMLIALTALQSTGLLDTDRNLSSEDIAVLLDAFSQDEYCHRAFDTLAIYKNRASHTLVSELERALNSDKLSPRINRDALRRLLEQIPNDEV